MYTFIDTTEAAGNGGLPSEALKINGRYLENHIPGYRTLHVAGREALSPVLTTYETGVRDGATLQNRRYPARILTVTYKLTCETAEAFREAYNTLGKLLDCQNAKLVFADEDDKYYRGTPSGIAAVEPGLNSVVGEFEITCTDPFKYSNIEYTATPDEKNGSFAIDYNGTYKSFPTLIAEFYNEEDATEDGEGEGTLTGNGDCGYVAFFNEDEKIIQMGDPDETDGETFAKSQTLVNQTFKSSTSWGTTAKKLWTVNGGPALPLAATKAGSVKMDVMTISGGVGVITTTGGGQLLLNKSTTSGNPRFDYKVSAKVTKRLETSATVSFVVTASLKEESNYFGNGYGLKASVYAGGAWHSATLKKTTAKWEGQTGHSVTISATITGLNASSSSISGIKFKCERTDSNGTAGILSETACSNISLTGFSSILPDEYHLVPASYGATTNKWHGPCITRTIPADAAGETGAENFTLTYKQCMAIQNASFGVKQLGGFWAVISDASDKIVAAVHIQKSTSGKTANCGLYVAGSRKHSTTFDLSHNNKYFGNASDSVKTSTIRKTGNKIYFSLGGYERTITDDGLSGMKAAKVSFMFEAYYDSAPLAWNGLQTAKFVKNNCQTYKDIPNKFSAGDVVKGDCKTGKIYLNGKQEHELGALGNDWEEFYLTPGLNQIGTSYSNFTPDEYAPAFSIKYREVFL